MTMANPVHPGEILLEEMLKPLELNITRAAGILGVSRQALSALVNARADLSPEMALRIEKAFGPRADFMIRLQSAYSIARAKKRKKEILQNVLVFHAYKQVNDPKSVCSYEDAIANRDQSIAKIGNSAKEGSSDPRGWPSGERLLNFAYRRARVVIRS